MDHYADDLAGADRTSRSPRRRRVGHSTGGGEVAVFDLEISVRDLHLAEMAEVAAAANEVFTPLKMNIESLGNGAPHLHWWITPRHQTDPRPRGPIWEDLDFLRTHWGGGVRPTSEECATSRSLLVDALRARDVAVDVAT
jgi:diadenosine tetraphosphate (Ap4A) HIT family hydrolase